MSRSSPPLGHYRRERSRYAREKLRHPASPARRPVLATPLPSACSDGRRVHSLRFRQGVRSSRRFRGRFRIASWCPPCWKDRYALNARLQRSSNEGSARIDHITFPASSADRQFMPNWSVPAGTTKQDQNKTATSPPIERRAIAIAALAGSCGDNRSEKTTANLRENIDGFVRPL
jgi:hypothetical protein